MNDTVTRLSDYENAVLALIDAKIDADQALRTGPVYDRANIILWRKDKGSAPTARQWFIDIVAENDDKRPAEIARMLSEKVEAEIAARPKWFSVKHLRGIVAFAERAAI